jgi:hypothetical protein
MWHDGYLPEERGVAIVIPIYKKESAYYVQHTNYMPKSFQEE